MAPSITLLGPPEIYRKPSRDEATIIAVTMEEISDPFVKMMGENYNEAATRQTIPMGLTENLSPTFLSSGNPCLDFFFHVVPDTPSDVLSERLRLAWDHNPLTTLKLICHLRGVRGTGKSDKEGYYTAALWLHKHHPKTLACNVEPIAGFGYFKDLPEILFRLHEGDDVRQRFKNEWKQKKWGIRGQDKFKRRGKPSDIKKKQEKVESVSTIPKEDRILAAMKTSETEKRKARENREDKKISMAKKAVERYIRDPDYKFLYDRISDFFAEHLKADIQYLHSGELRKIGLAAKWCPSLDSSFDRSTLLCESIARKFFPRESYLEYQDVEDAHYAYRVRDRLRKEVLVPLRKALELPEVYIGANDWGSLPYNRVASVAMKFYKEKFLKHDKDRFEAYLEKVKEGKAKIAAGALLPHEIVMSLNDGDGGQVAELQWKRVVNDMTEKGKLKNCMAISDVSGSMSGIPMEVAVALGLLVSEMSEDPWKGKLITFSADPTLHLIEGDNLLSKTTFIRNMPWGMNTDFQKVFDLILEVAVNGNLKPDDMIKRLFVFSDMEFDAASVHPWETDYQAIKRKFTEKGYGPCVPEIVFWNLRDSRSTPVCRNQNGVALVSGFSKNLLTLFLEDDGSLTPESVMETAIAGEEYEKLVVLD